MKRLLKAVSLAAICACCQFAAPLALADDDDAGVPQVPGDDIFGFTAPTDLGNTGDKGFANENDGRIGKRMGTYGALNTKYEFSYTINTDWWIAASPFLAFNHIRNVPGLPDKNTSDFDGLSMELAHRLLVRSDDNPWAITASIEPRWGRIDGESGFRSENYGFGAKLFVDRVLVPDQLYWGGNLIWSPVWAKDPMVPNNNLINSTLLVSSAIAWEAVPDTLFLGAEASYTGSYGRIVTDHVMGQAIFAGPTVLWKINDQISVNATYQPQVWGRSSQSPGLYLDLDNFERATFRFKVSIGLQ